MYRQDSLIFLTLVLTILFISCGGDGGNGLPTDPTDSDAEPAPEITSVEPDSGKFGTEVNITGMNFDSDPDANKVTFNGTEALVVSASDTQLVAEVPKGAETGPVEVSIEDQSVKGSEFKYIPTITVTTYAGTGQQGYQDGQGTVAQFNYPGGMDIDATGNIYVADIENDVVRKIDQQKTVSTIAGTGDPGYKDGTAFVAEFNKPTDLALDNNESILLVGQNNNLLRNIDTSGEVMTVAGDTVGDGELKDGVGREARFHDPLGLTITENGTMYVADFANHCVRKITSAGEVTTVAGTGTAGYQDSDLENAQFDFPVDLASDQEGNLLVTDSGNNAIRKINFKTGEVSTIFRSHNPGYVDGPLEEAKIDFPAGLNIGKDGTIYFCDLNNHSVRKITLGGKIVTVAGSGQEGFTDGDAEIARFNQPTFVTIAEEGVLFVSDQKNHSIRKITIE